MLSRAAYARSVCLRCQLRLLDRPRAHSSLRIPPFRTDFLQRRLYSAESAWDKLESASDDKEAASSPSAPPGKDSPSSGTKPAAASAAGEPTQPVNRPSPIRKIYSNRKRRDEDQPQLKGQRGVHMQSRELDATMLGKKARAIVMREVGWDSKRRSGLRIEELLPQEVDLQASLEAGEKEFTMEDVLANIDDIRPTDPIVSQSEFDELQEVLLNGFTVPQLRAYLAREKTKARTKPVGEVASQHHPQYNSQYDWIQNETPWTPFQTPEIVGSPKERLALTLMIEVWRLSIREMVNGTGFYGTSIKRIILALLERDHRRLDALRKDYLDEGDDIQISNQRLSITATKAKTETILKKLDDVARAVVTKHVLAPWLSNYDARSTLLHHLSQLTDTLITYSTKTHTVRVSWIKDGAAGVNYTGVQMDNVVQRLLYTAFHPGDASVSLKYDPKDDNGRLVPESRGREKLPWKDRLTQWSRYVTPVSRVSPAESAFPFKASDVLPLPLQHLVKDPNATWSKIYTSTVASFGQILHRNQDGFNLAAAADAKNHIFSPTSPPPASLEALIKKTLTTPTHPILTTLVLGFHAHPSLHEMTDLPRRLELRLTVPSDPPDRPLLWADFQKELIAVMNQSFTDIAYPSEPVDMRLSQSSLLAMAPTALEDSAFREYIERAKLNLTAGYLHPPPEVELSNLPLGNGDSVIGGTAKYVFSGLEIRRNLDVKYFGHKLNYTSVEAGLHGGRRSELVFEARPREDGTPDEVVKAAAERFLPLAHDLAMGKVAKWVGERDVAREFDDVYTGDIEAEQAQEEDEHESAEGQWSTAESSADPAAAEEGEDGTQKKDEV